MQEREIEQKYALALEQPVLLTHEQARELKALIEQEAPPELCIEIIPEQNFPMRYYLQITIRPYPIVIRSLASWQDRKALITHFLQH